MYKSKVILKKISNQRVRKRIRKKISGTLERPRFFVKRSNRYIYVQVIDDENGVTLASASTLEKEFKEKNKDTKNIKAAMALGELVAKRLKKKKMDTIVFDRGYYPYHGRIKALAEAMQKGGIRF